MSNYFNQIVNNSITNDPYISTYQASNSTTFRNNYAPINQMMGDSTYTRNINPLGRYLDPNQTQKKFIPTTTNFYNQLIQGSKVSNKKLDLVSLNYNSNSESLKPTQDIIISPINQFESSTQLFKMKTNQKNIEKSLVENSKLLNLITRNRVEHFSNEKLETSPTFITKEAFEKINKDDTYIDQIYIQALESKSLALCNYLKSNSKYWFWKSSWEKMNNALTKSKFSFTRLNESDSDIAYTINKGESTKFRIRGNDYKYIPLNISQYVLFHEMAHAANEKIGHGREFCDKLSVLCLAAFELGMIDLRKIKKEVYLTNNQPILCNADMKNEIINGCKIMIKNNPDLKDHYSEVIKFIQLQS